MLRASSQRGFTAVELLITLFVAAAFLIAGSQLFSVVIRDGSDTRAESKAANVAYDYMRQYSTTDAKNPCTPVQPLNAAPVTIPGLSAPKMTIILSCPQQDAPAISKIEAVVTYGSDNKVVKFATFVDASKATSPVGNLTTGLIGWWKMNGNANDSSGAPTNNGTVTAATLGTGQNGGANTAYTFNGTSSYITIPSANLRPTTGITVSAWIKTPDVQSANNQKIMSTTEGGGYSLFIGDAACAQQIGFNAHINGSYRAVCASMDASNNNTWVLTTGVFDGSSVRIYFNGSLAASVGTSGAFAHSTAPFCIGSEPNGSACTVGNYFSGSIDDLRVYNRALTPSEIQLLYTGGAQ